MLESKQIYRAKVIKTFLLAGVALSKTDAFRELLEESGYRFRRYLFDLIQFIVNDEETQIKKIKGKFVS